MSLNPLGLPDDGLDDAALLSAFHACTIPNEQWTHRRHVRVAYLLLRDAGFAEASAGFTAGLRRLNAANRVPESPSRGYHETITRAWLALVAAAVRSEAGTAAEDCGSDRASDAFLDRHPALLDPRLLGRHYSHDRLFSPEAKSAWVPPDRAPLPTVDGG